MTSWKFDPLPSLTDKNGQFFTTTINTISNTAGDLYNNISNTSGAFYNNMSNTEIKNTMNGFLEKYKNQYEILHINYQLALKKII